MDFVPFVVPTSWGWPQGLSDIVNQKARLAGVPSVALGTILEMETEGHNIFQRGVTRGPGCGVGECQITYDVDWTNLDNPLFYGKKHRWRTYQLIQQHDNIECAAVEFLAPAIVQAVALALQYPGTPWSENAIYLAFAVYNAGYDAVSTQLELGLDPDLATTDGYAGRAFALYEAAREKSHNA